MIIIQRLMPYVSAVVVTITLACGVYFPEHWLVWASILFVVPIIVVLSVRQSHWRLEYLGLSLPMVLLLLSAYTFLLIQESTLLINISLIVVVIFYFLFEKNLTVFLFQPSKYIPYSLEHISIYCNVLASFYMYVSLFIFFVLGLSRLRYIFILAWLLTAILVWQALWIQKIPWTRSRWFVLAISCFVTEWVMVLHYWPTSFFVTGVLLTLGLYLLLHLSRHYLTDTLSRLLVWRYVTISSIGIVILLATAQWYY